MEPGRAQGWLATLWPLVERASGVTLLVMLLMLALAFVELKRVHTTTERLVERLLTTKDAHLAWMQQYVHCTPPSTTP